MPELTGSIIYSETEVNEIDRICDEFELAWGNKDPPRIEDYLPDDSRIRQAVLINLVHLDLEHRLNHGDDIRVEEYFDRFGQLKDNAEDAVDLIFAEYDIRRHRKEAVTAEEYVARFPSFLGLLQRVLTLSADQSRARRRSPMRLNCPNCSGPIAVAAPKGHEGQVVCPCCGTGFQMDVDVDTSWKPDKLPQLGKFQLLEAVGRGAFGTVYKARDTELDRVVALKVPRSGSFHTQDDEDRFMREARNIAQLSHAGIVPVYDFGKSDLCPYIVTEFVEGVTLADALAVKEFTPRESARLMGQLAATIDNAHRHGVIHRDLKPSNIMLATVQQDGSTVKNEANTMPGTESAQKSTARSTDSSSRYEYLPRIMDFGLARREAGEATVTLSGQVIGTPAYMSPEQARGDGHQADRRSDVYSLGVILFELLTGSRPFTGNQRMLLHQVLNDEPPSPRSLRKKIPRDLETICTKAMAKEPLRRYQTAAEFSEDLRRWLDGEPILARPVHIVERAWSWIWRNPRTAGLTGVVCVLLLMVATLSVALFLRVTDQENVAEHNEDKDVRLNGMSASDPQQSFSPPQGKVVWDGTLRNASGLAPKADDPEGIVHLIPDAETAFRDNDMSYLAQFVNDRESPYYQKSFILRSSRGEQGRASWLLLDRQQYQFPTQLSVETRARAMIRLGTLPDGRGGAVAVALYDLDENSKTPEPSVTGIVMRADINAVNCFANIPVVPERTSNADYFENLRQSALTLRPLEPYAEDVVHHGETLSKLEFVKPAAGQVIDGERFDGATVLVYLWEQESQSNRVVHSFPVTANATQQLAIYMSGPDECAYVGGIEIESVDMTSQTPPAPVVMGKRDVYVAKNREYVDVPLIVDGLDKTFRVMLDEHLAERGGTFDVLFDVTNEKGARKGETIKVRVDTVALTPIDVSRLPPDSIEERFSLTERGDFSGTTVVFDGGEGMRPIADPAHFYDPANNRWAYRLLLQPVTNKYYLHRLTAITDREGPEGRSTSAHQSWVFVDRPMSVGVDDQCVAQLEVASSAIGNGPMAVGFYSAARNPDERRIRWVTFRSEGTTIEVPSIRFDGGDANRTGSTSAEIKERIDPTFITKRLRPTDRRTIQICKPAGAKHIWIFAWDAAGSQSGFETVSILRVVPTDAPLHLGYYLAGAGESLLVNDEVFYLSPALDLKPLSIPQKQEPQETEAGDGSFLIVTPTKITRS